MSANSDGSKNKRLTTEEQAAMKERSKELKAKKGKKDGESDVLEKIAAMQDSDRIMVERLHEIITASMPDLMPKTWYGMPTYANEDSRGVCFFQSAQKFKSRYATFGFSDKANLDDGSMWPVTFALKRW